MAKSKKRCFYNIQSGVFVVKYSILKKITDFFLILFIILQERSAF